MREDHKFRISTRERLWEEQDHKCAYCNRRITKDQASLDHIIPIIHIEKNYGETNLIVCCKRCNKEKLDYIVFTNLFDRIIYPIVDIPYFHRVNYIQKNKFKN